MANTDEIKTTSLVTLYPDDIISDSMHKINYNFEVLASKDDVSEQKINWLRDKYNQMFDDLLKRVLENDDNLANAIDTLNDKLDHIQPMFDVEDLINDAIANATIDLQRFITETEFQNGLNQALGNYVRSIDMEAILAGKDYITSAAFDEMMADATTGNAYAQRMVANAEFYKEYNASRGKDCFVYQTTEAVSNYSTLEEYYVAVQNEVDPNRKGMDDEGVLNALIRKAEQTFMVIYKQLSLIKQSVTNSEASIDIMAAINSTDGDRIVAAIFAKATELGSFLELYADEIVANAEHKLLLQTDAFEIRTTNFKVSPSGNVEAKSITLSDNVTAYDMKTYNMEAENMKATNIETHNMKAYDMEAYHMYGNDLTVVDLVANGITATNITLTSKGGNTSIDENGILHANGAIINGDVTAKKFNASKLVDVTTSDNYTGNITKTTTIDGSMFNISASGTLSNGTVSRDVTGNSLYIELLDSVENNDGGDITDTVMHCVPVLCMKYTDSRGETKTYMLKPGSWTILGGSVNSSDMRWYQQYGWDVMTYGFGVPTGSTPSSYYYSGTLNNSLISGTDNIYNGTFYVFNPENRTTFVGTTTDDKVYRLKVNLGTNPTGNLETLRSKDLVTSSATVSNVNENTVYALRSKLNIGGCSPYCDQAYSNTPIESSLCGTFKSCLDSTISAGVKYNYRKNYVTQMEDAFGMRNIYNFMLYALGGKVGENNRTNNTWSLQGGTAGNGVGATITGTEGFINNFPFCTGGFYTSDNDYGMTSEYFTYDVYACPMISITNYGKNASTTTDTIYIRCSTSMTGTYTRNYEGDPAQTGGETPIQYYTDPYLDNTPENGEFVPDTMSATMNFDCVLKLSSPVNYDPLSNKAEEEIMDAVGKFLTRVSLYDRNKTTINGQTHIQFNATIWGKTRVRDTFGYIQTYSGIALTKTKFV